MNKNWNIILIITANNYKKCNTCFEFVEESKYLIVFHVLKVDRSAMSVLNNGKIMGMIQIYVLSVKIIKIN